MKYSDMLGEGIKTDQSRRLGHAAGGADRSNSMGTRMSRRSDLSPERVGQVRPFHSKEVIQLPGEAYYPLQATMDHRDHPFP